MDFVAQGLDELEEVLQTDEVPLNIRRGLLSELLHYIARGHSGLDDALYATAYATCYDEGDLRILAGHLCALGQEWPLNHARSIYRHLGDRDKYLALRAQQMVYGNDYYGTSGLRVCADHGSFDARQLQCISGALYGL